MNGPNANFESTSDFLPGWNCITSGASKTNDLVWHDPSDESWITGYYISSREVTIKDRQYIKHKIRATHCGNPAHINGDAPLNPEAGTDIEILSTGVLNNKIDEHVQPGQYIRIQWLGKQKTKDGKNEYHNWDLGVATDVEPLRIQNGVVVSDMGSSTAEMLVPTPQATTQEAPAPQAAEATPATGESVAPADDDLPF